jgi:hypothetical protein
MNEQKKRWSRVDLPSNAEAPYEVYVNGIVQTEGSDFEVDGLSLFFFRPIRNEEKLGFFRWLILFIGIAGSYKQNDSVDIGCTVNGVREHIVNRPIVLLETPTDEERGMLIGSYSPGG